MKRGRRQGRLLKWIATAVCMLVVGVWILSIWWWVSVAKAPLIFQIDSGSLHFMDAPLFWELQDFHAREQGRWRGRWQDQAHDWSWAIEQYGHPANLAERCGLRLPSWHGDPSFASLRVPFWLVLAVCLLPTIWLWRRDRRIEPGYCGCGYNLTGNVSGVCPECGTAARADE